MTTRARWFVLVVAFSSLLFDGFELGLMPVASLSVSKDLLSTHYTNQLGGDWFARFTAALMLGAAVGGIILGDLGDRLGRARALGVSVLFYSVFAGLGAYATSQHQMLLLRFLVGLGVGGVWPNAISLVSECWPDRSKPVIAGIMGAALNAGILGLSQVAQIWPITPDNWRWLFQIAAAPAALGLLAILALPESPAWKAERIHAKPRQPLLELFAPNLLRVTIIGSLLGTIPLLGAWAASKWMIPWADAMMSASQPSYKSVVQGWWSLGAVLGSCCGSLVAHVLGRRLAYALISIGATVLTEIMFLGSMPGSSTFLYVVFLQGLVATLFFGWLPLYLPELFPTHVRAVGTGFSFNIGRFATAFGVLATGFLFTALGGSYAQVGAICALIYLSGAVVIWWAPNTSHRTAQH